mgnify:CR=1 FL=1
MGNILELQDISHAYHGMEGETLAISHLSFSLKQGDFVSIVGPSGCGKSTLLSIISGLIPPESGTVKPFKAERRARRSSFVMRCTFFSFSIPT